MTYPGDIKNLVLSITLASGASPNVTVTPVVSIIRLSDLSTVVTAAQMILVAGTQAIYLYGWNTTAAEDGDYLAIVSYASDGITVNSRLLEVFQLGDSRITGLLALDATVAKDVTVAKDGTVAHLADLTGLSPDNSVTVLAIKAKTDNLPSDPASLTVLNQIGANVQDLRDYEFGTWTIDKTKNPQVLTLLRTNQSTLTTFTLTDSPTQTQRAMSS
jgi:hypothetical protein